MNKRIILLIAISMLGPMTLNMFLPALPIMREDFQITTSVAQLFISVGMAFFTIGTAVYGFISDRYGRKPTMLIGLLLYTSGNLICAFSPSVALFLVGRSITTFGGAGIATSIRAAISDVYGIKKSTGVYSWMAVAMVLVPLVAPTLGGYITQISSWHWVFIVMSTMGLSALISTFMLIKETLSKKEELKERKVELSQDIKMVIRSKQWWIYALLCGIITSISFAFTSGMPYIGRDLFELSPAEYGTWLILGAIGYFIGSMVSAKIAEHKTVAFMTTVGTSISLAFSLLLVASYYFGFMSLLSIFATMSFMNFGAGLVVPSAMSAAINIKGAPKGAATSMQGLIHTAIPIFGVQFVGYAYDKTVVPLFMIILLFAFLSFVIALIGRRLNL